mmetsp:Transcript_7268/g.18909  ORF Transcript_7268/g.18909 Transcript_7268/m.18909 type:complete len:348 (-) Transcript_7268:2233-3276(-)
MLHPREEMRECDALSGIRANPPLYPSCSGGDVAGGLGGGLSGGLGGGLSEGGEGGGSTPGWAAGAAGKEGIATRPAQTGRSSGPVRSGASAAGSAKRPLETGEALAMAGEAKWSSDEVSSIRLAGRSRRPCGRPSASARPATRDCRGTRGALASSSAAILAASGDRVREIMGVATPPAKPTEPTTAVLRARRAAVSTRDGERATWKTGSCVWLEAQASAKALEKLEARLDSCGVLAGALVGKESAVSPTSSLAPEEEAPLPCMRESASRRRRAAAAAVARGGAAGSEAGSEMPPADTSAGSETRPVFCSAEGSTVGSVGLQRERGSWRVFTLSRVSNGSSAKRLSEQ